MAAAIVFSVRLAIPLLIGCFLVAAPVFDVVAQPADPEELLREAERNYEQLEYEAALRVLIKLQQLPNVDPLQRARGFLYMGVAFTALGRAENAVQAFMEVLKIKPDFRLPSGVSPSIRSMFSQALKRLGLSEEAPPEGAGGAGAGGAPPTAGGEGGAAAAGQPPAAPQAPSSPAEVVAKAPRSVLPGMPVTVTISVDDPKTEVAELVLRWRLLKGPDYSTITLPFKEGQTKVEATIPGTATAGATGRLLYYVEARDAEGNALTQDGTPDVPRGISLVAPHRATSRRWVWWTAGVGGAVLLAGGIVAAVLLSGGGGGPSNTVDVSLVIN